MRVLPLTALLAFLATFWVSEARACVICNPYPEITHSDRLLNSDAVALAREDPAKPFFYVVTEVLKGSVEPAASELFVDTQTRRRLQLNPKDRVVLYRNTSDSQWRRLTYADVEYQEIIAAVVAQADTWQPHGTSRERIAYFSQLLSSAHKTIRAPAYLEVGRAAPCSTTAQRLLALRRDGPCYPCAAPLAPAGGR